MFQPIPKTLIMIVNYTEAGWELITQRAHGILAAQLAQHWKKKGRPQRWLETLLAIAEHDDAMIELDGEHLLTEAGGPLNFTMKNFELEHCLRLSRFTQSKSRFIALLTSMHMDFVYRKDMAQDPAAKAFLLEQRALQARWRKELDIGKEEAEKIYAFMEWCDAFSLLLCQRAVQPESRAVEISRGPEQEKYELFQAGDGQLTLVPWPFEVNSFEVAFESRTIAQLQFTSSKELRTLFFSCACYGNTLDTGAGQTGNPKNKSKSPVTVHVDPGRQCIIKYAAAYCFTLQAFDPVHHGFQQQVFSFKKMNMDKGQQHYLITGGAGFIGSNLVKKLLQQNSVRITCIDNFDSFYSRKIKEANIEGFEASGRFCLLPVNLDTVTADELKKQVKDAPNAIIHLAARAGVRPSILNPRAYQQTNIIGTQTLLDYAVQTGVQQFVFASSSSVYGVNKNLPWNEEERLLPISPYAMTKLAGEGLGHVYSHLYGLSFIALRFFTVYGPGQRPDLAIHKFTKSILQGAPIPVFGDGSTSRDYTFVDDIVHGIISAISYKKSPYEIINLGNHQTVSLQALIETLEKVIGKKAIIDRQPEQPGDVPHTYADVHKAEQLLGYKAGTDFADGLASFCNWFLANKLILEA